MLYWNNFFFVSIGAMSFGTSVYIYTTPVLGPNKVRVFIFSVPFLAMAIAIAIFYPEETWNLNIVIGGLLSMSAIYIVNKK